MDDRVTAAINRVARDRYMRAAGAHYLMTVKANQPRLLAACAAAWAADNASQDIQTARGHGRTEERILRAVTAAGIDFPGAAQLFRILRYTGGLDGQRATKEVAYGLTSLTAEQANAGCLAGWSAGTGRSKTPSTGSATSPSAKTPPAPEPATSPPSWPPSATPSSPRSASPEPRTSPKLDAGPPPRPTGSTACSPPTQTWT